MLAFVSLVVIIHAGMQSYVAWWAIRNFPGLRIGLGALSLFILLGAAGLPFSLYCLRAFRGAWTERLAYAGFLWLGSVFIALTATVLGDLAVLSAPAARPWAKTSVLGVTAAACLWAVCNASRPPVISDIDVPIPGLSADLDGFTVVQLSDLHLGVTVSLEKFSQIVAQVDALKPDLIVMTGDIFDAGLRDDGAVERIGAGLKAGHGVLAVMGNHEFYHGVEVSSRTFAGMGARLLRNEVATLPGGLQVAGVDDVRTAGLSAEDVAAVLAKLDPARPSLFLCHQPLGFDVAARAGVGLMLSGHTHAGQIFPFGLIVRLFYPRFNGLYREGRSSLYVTSGAGQWGPPMRLFTRAEIVRFTLRAALQK
ncbi:MAG: hypothetical protein A2V88_14740 [Elusimicrobia bacterium RBG_16_66_12]|nr:MAG: hypothetical protein A2V88_14740 [Elusimicrobia bacterium RBG_16_66_12]